MVAPVNLTDLISLSVLDKRCPYLYPQFKKKGVISPFPFLSFHKDVNVVMIFAVE